MSTPVQLLIEKESWQSKTVPMKTYSSVVLLFLLVKEKMEPTAQIEIVLKKLPHQTYCLSHGLFKVSARNWCWFLEKAAFGAFRGIQACLQDFEPRIRDDMAAFHAWCDSNARAQSACSMPPLKTLRTKEDLTSWRKQVMDYQARHASTAKIADFEWQHALAIRSVSMRKNVFFSFNEFENPSASYKVRDVDAYYEDNDDSWSFGETKSSLGSTPPRIVLDKLPEARPIRKSFGDSLGELLDSLDIWLSLHNSTDFVKIQTQCQELLSIAGAILDGCECYNKHYLPVHSRLTNQRKMIKDVLNDEMNFFNAYQDVVKNNDLKSAFSRWPKSETTETWKTQEPP